MFDYFYGQSGERFSYFRMPKILFRDIKFKDLSTDAKTLYGILLDRMGLSVKNGWLDEQGRVYIIFPVQEVMDALGYADNKATKRFRELEKFGLIAVSYTHLYVYKRQGDGSRTHVRKEFSVGVSGCRRSTTFPPRHAGRQANASVAS